MRRIVRTLVPHSYRAELRRNLRRIQNLPVRPRPTRRFAANLDAFPACLFEHSSTLLRAVPDHLMPLQHNKVRNLKLGCASMDRLLLEPGDIFSFCTLVGRTSYRRGFVDGLEMHDGKMLGAAGGGLCQLANLLFWMALHLDLEILERHRHGLDLFPDDGRTVPFGMGATVFYNYRDLRFRNSLSQPLLLRVGVDPPLLRGAFYSDRELPYQVEVFEQMHRFYRDDQGVVWRENQVAKRITQADGNTPQVKQVAHNLGRVCYEVDEVNIERKDAPKSDEGFGPCRLKEVIRR
jgi:vancomycin resistance protein VanW